MSSGTDAYRVEIEKLEEAKNAAEDCAAIIHDASKKLSHLKKAFVAMPDDIVMANLQHGISGGDLPKAEDLKRVLADYQRAGSVLHNTWTNLAQEERKALQPPDRFY